MARKLTIKQEKFINKFLECGNASEAYRFAYSTSRMKDTTVNVKAIELLRNGKIAVRLKELQEETKKRNEVDVDYLIEKAKHIAEFDVAEIFDEDNNIKKVKDIPKNIRKSIGNITVTETTTEFGTTTKTIFKVDDRIKAIDLLGRLTGSFEKDNAQIKGNALRVEVVTDESFNLDDITDE